MANILYDGTYLRYKVSTDKLFDWLEDTAGKDRAARSTKKLKQYARDIVSETPAITIPQNILSATDDAITGRRMFAAFYADDTSKLTGQARADQLKSDKQHTDFIKALENIRETLQSGQVEDTTQEDLSGFVLSRKRGAPAPRRLPVPVAVKNGSRPFDNDEDDSNDSTSTSTDTRIEDDPLQNAMALWAYLKDAQEIREYMKAAWIGYLQSKIRMRAITRLTEEAINLLHMLHCGVEHLYDDIATLESLRGLLRAEIDPADVEDKSPKLNNSNVDNLVCAPAFQTLHWLRNTLTYIIETDFEPPAGHGHDVPYSTHPFAHALIAISNELDAMVRRSGGKLHELEGSVDNYTFSLLKLSREYRLRLWFVCATQIHMDIWDILKGDMARSFCHASVNVWATHTELRDFQDNLKTLNPAVLELMNRHQASRSALWRAIETEQKLGVQAGWTVKATNGSYQRSRASIFFPDTLLRLLPLLPQYTTRRMLIDQQESAAELQNNDSVFIACIHLYRVLRRCLEPEPSWLDVEYIVEQQPTTLKLADFALESTFKEIAAQMSRQLGLDLGLGSMQQTPVLPSTVTTGQQASKLLPIDMLHLCNERMSNDSAIENFMIYYKVIGKWMRVGRVDLSKYISKEVSAAWSERRMTPTQLLTLLERVFLEDDTSLLFKHLEVTQRAIDFVGRTIDDIAKLEKRSARHASGAGDRMYASVHNLLWEAALSKEGKEILKTIDEGQFQEMDGHLVDAMQYDTESRSMREDRTPENLFDQYDSGRKLGRIDGIYNYLPSFLDRVKKELGRPARKREQISSGAWQLLRASFTFYIPWELGPATNTPEDEYAEYKALISSR